jgi:prevent-host-death family protein
VTKSYSIADARAHLSDILDDVEAGNDVRLTRRGKAVAVVLSTQRHDMLRGENTNFRDAYRSFIGRHAPEEIGLDAGFANALRDRKPGRRVKL